VRPGSPRALEAICFVVSAVAPSAYHIFSSELAAHLRSFVRRRLAHPPCSLTLSADHASLFAANAGSGSVSVFRVKGTRLELTDHVATEGSEPNSVARFGSLVYVSNTAGSSSVVGSDFNNGKLVRIPNSLRFLSGNAVASGSVAFSPDGQFLIVTEKATTNLDVFKVLSDGSLSQAAITKSVGPGAFRAGFARHDVAVVSETGTSAPNSSAISSYIVRSNL
jgi:6-phosphogluconolactonase